MMVDAPTSSILGAALAALTAGLNVAPVREDGTKRPDLDEWTSRKARMATEEEVRAWFANGRTGMGVICGAVSGNLEMFEFEGRAIDEGIGQAFLQAADAAGLGDVVDRIAAGYSERTPSGGVHWLYRCDEMSGNTKLARRPATDEELAENPEERIKVLLETRGEGGYTVTAPSHGRVHDTGRPWEIVQGEFNSIATITPEERRALFDVARAFDQLPKAEPRPAATTPRPADGDRPGDEFNARATWASVLEPHGWAFVFQRGDTAHWRRPGKTMGISATTNHADSDLLYVFSSSTPFEPERGYSKFSAYAHLAHDADFEAAGRALVEAGYGAAGHDRRENGAKATASVAGAAPDPMLTRLEQRAERAEAERRGEDIAPPELFRLMTASELLAMDRTYRWLVRRMLLEPTYGQVAGEAKTLKTYIATMIWVGLASGRPVLDIFEPDEARPVVAYVGEGGAIPFARRLERVASAMGVDADNLPLHLSFDVAPIPSTRFRDSLERDLDGIQPGLVGIDPLYAYHGTDTKASDLHQEGSLLASVSALCVNAGASLLINNHFNQTGSGRSLTRITQAGSTEWVDSWLFLSHREPADVDGGRFKLLLDVGSRQWGGTTWNVDLSVGRFDHDTGEFDGDISWEVQRHVESDQEGDDKERVLAVLDEHPFEFTKEELAKAAGGSLARMREVVAGLDANRAIEARKVPRTRSDGRTFHQWVFGVASEAGRCTTEQEVESA